MQGCFEVKNQLFHEKRGRDIVLFLNGIREYPFKDIDYSVWLFVLALMEGGYHAIIAIPAGEGNNFEDSVDFLERVRPGLKVRETKGGGVLTVTPASYSGAHQTSLRFCESLDFKRADWTITRELFQEAFPEAKVWHHPK